MTSSPLLFDIDPGTGAVKSSEAWKPDWQGIWSTVLVAEGRLVRIFDRKDLLLPEESIPHWQLDSAQEGLCEFGSD